MENSSPINGRKSMGNWGYTLPEANIWHLKMDAWKMILSLWDGILASGSVLVNYCLVIIYCSGSGGLDSNRGAPVSHNPFHKGIPEIQTTNPNHQLTISC